MNSTKKTARIIGVLIIVAYGVVGAFILEPGPALIALELVSGLAVLGAAVLLFPILKPHNKNLTFLYTFIKLIEGLFIVLGALMLLSSISQVDSIRTWFSDANVYTFGTRFLILAIIFYQSRLVPRILAVWALIASVMLMISFMISAVNPSITVSPAISHLPVISNELILALWLIIKGFNPSAIASTSADTDN
jgi:hypothetical protein